MSKEEKRLAKSGEGVCPVCGYDCRDKESLQRHMDWAHRVVVEAEKAGKVEK